MSIYVFLDSSLKLCLLANHYLPILEPVASDCVKLMMTSIQFLRQLFAALFILTAGVVLWWLQTNPAFPSLPQFSTQLVMLSPTQSNYAPISRHMAPTNVSHARTVCNIVDYGILPPADFKCYHLQTIPSPEVRLQSFVICYPVTF